MEEVYSLLESKRSQLKQWYEENATHDMFLEEALKFDYEVNNGLRIRSKCKENR